VIPLTLEEIAGIVAGELCDAAPGRLVHAPATVDSRAVVPGGLFVAVRGSRVDGHDFAAAAVEAGAAAVLAQRPVGVPAVVVADPVDALGRLARAVVDRLPGCRVVAVTGSQGKTSTKDLLAQVLEPAGPTVAPQGNLNNEIGVPLTALTAEWDTRHLVVEMGARAGGQIAYLCGITPPAVSVVLNVGVAHLAEFGSREKIAAAKGELVEALPAGGLAVLNADDPLVMAMLSRTAARALTFGAGRGADVRVSGLALDAGGRPGFHLHTPEGSRSVRLRLGGAHQAHNAAAAAAAALGCGLGLDAVVDALSAAEPRSRWRMEISELADGVTLVNDAYNANPDSMRAALAALAALGRAGPTERRTIAVLGEMCELGPTSDAEHAALGELAARSGVTELIAVGSAAEPIYRAAARARWPGNPPELVTDVESALHAVRERLRPGDVVLVKASRAAGLEAVAAGLLSQVGQR
jgi:UDP-N-acetylmuramoyl-tripeptide--D-alanyl-D-alanine ligase